jgi:hypothetical protein
MSIRDTVPTPTTTAATTCGKPKILYPYHFGDTDPARLAPLLKDEPGIELRIRELR